MFEIQALHEKQLKTTAGRKKKQWGIQHLLWAITIPGMDR